MLLRTFSPERVLLYSVGNWFVSEFFTSYKYWYFSNSKINLTFIYNILLTRLPVFHPFWSRYCFRKRTNVSQSLIVSLKTKFYAFSFKKYGSSYKLNLFITPLRVEFLKNPFFAYVLKTKPLKQNNQDV